MSPVKSIKQFCIWCSNSIRAERFECQVESCSLHPFRIGTRPRGTRPLKAIRIKCLDCSAYTKKIGDCEEINCSLHPLRFGKRRLEHTSISLSLFQNAVPATPFKDKRPEDIKSYGENLSVEKTGGMCAERCARDISLSKLETFAFKP